ncbi:MAG: response regulator [Nitrospirae bacterium]|nr:response regulator [Nitrospirota bacterium]
MLVADDNQLSLQIISEMLRSMSFDVVEVSSGVDAIKSVIEADNAGIPFVIAFLDWQMPGLDGIETATQIAALKLSHDVPHRIIVTAYGTEDAFNKAEKAFLMMLVKPVSSSTLFEAAMAAITGGTHTQCKTGVDGYVRTDLAPISGARVLLLEDNDLNQQVAMELLTEFGLNAYLAENGQVALKMVCENQYDIVLMDVQMPVMDGITATLEIRKLKEHANLPIIAMTANAMVSDRDNCMTAGMNDHVAKPIDPDELCDCLLRWIPPLNRADAINSDAENPDITVVQVVAPHISDASGQLATLYEVDGLDVANGLKRVLGKPAFYLSLLKKFAAGQANSPNEITAALAEGRRNDAERIAHTTKGTAGNIGAINVQQVAGRVEAAVKNNAPDDEIQRIFDEFDGTLRGFLHALMQAMPNETMQAVTAVVDLQALIPTISKIEKLLADYDSDATEVFSESAVLLRSAFKDDAAEIENAIQSFDFELALSLLSRAKEGLRILK